MNGFEASAHAKGLCAKISVITGWQLPNDPEYINVLNEQLFKKMVDDYQDLNIDEFEFAMREYGTKIKDWGKSLNLAMIDEPLSLYMAKRKELSEYEERISQKKELPVSPQAADWKERCEDCYQKFLAGKFNTDSWPVEIYGEFERCGHIAEGLFNEFIADAEVQLLHRLNTELQEAKLSMRPTEINHIQETIERVENSEDADLLVVVLSKKIAVLELFKYCQEIKLKNLFVKG